MDVRTGDRVEVVSNKVQVAPRRGTVARVIQEDPLKLEVHWGDDRVTIIEPRYGNLRVISEEDA